MKFIVICASPWKHAASVLKTLLIQPRFRPEKLLSRIQVSHPFDKGCKTPNMSSIQRSFYLLNATLSVLLLLTIGRSVLIVLVFEYKGVLGNLSMQRTQQFSAFGFCFLTERTQLNAAHAK